MGGTFTTHAVFYWTNITLTYLAGIFIMRQHHQRCVQNPWHTPAFNFHISSGVVSTSVDPLLYSKVLYTYSSGFCGLQRCRFPRFAVPSTWRTFFDGGKTFLHDKIDIWHHVAGLIQAAATAGRQYHIVGRGLAIKPAPLLLIDHQLVCGSA